MNDRSNPQRLQRLLNKKKHFNATKQKDEYEPPSKVRRWLKEAAKDQETADELREYTKH